jgi:carotenoid cleavage dioxygenase-like enzyme
MASVLLDEKVPTRPRAHPYLSGNFAPIDVELPLTPCTYHGTLPPELAGGQYVRNGGNPAQFADQLAHDHQRAHYHWFDGDGMLAGVYFRRGPHGRIQPEFVSAHVLTDVHLHAHHTPALRRPLVPSVALFVDPLASLLAVLAAIARAIALVLASHLPGALARVRTLSVANTSVLYHDGRALATCESGPPLRFVLPGLQTAGWFDGVRAEGEAPQPGQEDLTPFGAGDAVLGWVKKWTTAHVGLFS